MLIASVRHKGLRRLFTHDDVSGLPANHVGKLRKMIAFLQDATGIDELRSIPTWHAHVLAGDRKGTWALHVSPNWRLTFGVDVQTGEIVGLDLEDYH
jgi:proteic killer suppression protein